MAEQFLPPLLSGEHVLEQTIEDCRIVAIDREHDLAKLSLSIKSLQMAEREANRPSTTLAIYLNLDAARKLLLDLHNLSNSIGWTIPGNDAGYDSTMPKMVRASPRRSHNDS